MSLHKILGRKLSLFIFLKQIVGPIWLENGLKVKDNLMYILNKTINSVGEYEFETIETPQICPDRLLIDTGHVEKYQENLFYLNKTQILKPMSCPLHALYFSDTVKENKKLPRRIRENGRVTRNEASGAIDGLMRQYSFTQDDMHIFLSSTDKKSLEDEIHRLLDLITKIYTICGFQKSNYKYNISGDYAMEQESNEWKNNVNVLETVLQKRGESYSKSDDAAFYGPKIDIMVNWKDDGGYQVGTIQLDSQLSKNMKIQIDNDIPLVLHCAIYGSYERFIGVLLESNRDHLPYHVSPYQFKFCFNCLPYNDIKYNTQHKEIIDLLNKMGYIAYMSINKYPIDCWLFVDNDDSSDEPSINIPVNKNSHDGDIVRAMYKEVQSKMYCVYAIWGMKEINNILQVYKTGNWSVIDEVNINLNIYDHLRGIWVSENVTHVADKYKQYYLMLKTKLCQIVGFLDRETLT